MSIEKMPEEYKGEFKKSGGYTKNPPREWTEKEIEWVNALLSKGHTIKEIAESTDRSLVSVQIKIKRLAKKNNEYNKKHVQEKYEYNAKFLELIKPKTVIDAYTGEKNYYSEYITITNDKNIGIVADYHLDAFEFMCNMYAKGKKADLIDLDPFGSAYDSFDIAIKLAKKGLVITLGELGHKRWKRLDYVKTRYDIERMEDFTIDKLVEYIQKIGLRNKKKLTPVYIKEWQNIGRVWFKVEPIKITEQWELTIENEM